MLIRNIIGANRLQIPEIFRFTFNIYIRLHMHTGGERLMDRV